MSIRASKRHHPSLLHQGQRGSEDTLSGRPLILLYPFKNFSQIKHLTETEKSSDTVPEENNI